MKYSRLAALIVSIAIAIPFAVFQTTGSVADFQTTAFAESDPSSEVSWTPYMVFAGRTRIVGRYGDNMQYDGGDVTPVPGYIRIKVDPVENTGEIRAVWWDPRENAVIKIVQTVFMPPDHPSGVISGGGADRTIVDDPIAINAFEHGSTGVGAPIVTNLFTYLATWGPAQVYKNGVLWKTLPTHTMLTEGVRDETTNQVLNADESGFFSPMSPDDGFTDPADAQVHLIVRSNEPDPNNFPPFTLFWHIMFYDVQIAFTQVG